MRFANGRPGEQAQRAGDQRHEQRFAGDQPADLRRGRAEGAQHRGLPAALGDRERERPGDDEQGDRAGDAAERAEDGDQPGAIRRGRIAGVGIGGVPAIEHLEPVPEALLQAVAQRGRGRPGLGDHTDRVDSSGSAGQRGGDRRAVKNTAAWLSIAERRGRRRGRSRGSARRRSG